MTELPEAGRERIEAELERELEKRGLTRRDLVKGGVAMASAIGLGSLLAACGGGGDTAAPAEPPAAPPAEPPAAPAEPPAPAPPAEPAAEPPAPAPTPTPSEPPAPAGPAGDFAAADVGPDKPFQPTSGFTGTLRAVGLGVDLIDPIKEMGEARLGFKLDFKVVSTTDMEQIALTQPESFDVFAGYQHQPDKLWASGSLQPIERAKIVYWDQVIPIFKTGRIDPASTTCTLGDGDAPFRTIYVDPDATGTWPSSKEAPPGLEGQFVQWLDEGTGQTVGDEPPLIKGVPQNFNMDSLGYNGDVIQKEPDQVGWAELFNESYSGRVAMLGDPAVALQDAANAAKELGLMEFGSLGNMTPAEMDGLFAILTELKKKDHFRAFWVTFDESVNLMVNGEVVIESMWSPAVYLAIAQGTNVRYAAPVGGYRGWAAQQGISSKVTDPVVLGAAYDYLNWWLSGEPATIMMNQGYYNGAMGNLKAWVDPDEYDYWVLGTPAAKDLAPVFGKVGDIKAGTTRDGGSLFQRGCPYSSWNSFFNESEYQVSKWNEFQAA